LGHHASFLKRRPFLPTFHAFLDGRPNYFSDALPGPALATRSALTAEDLPLLGSSVENLVPLPHFKGLKEFSVSTGPNIMLYVLWGLGIC